MKYFQTHSKCPGSQLSTTHYWRSPLSSSTGPLGCITHILYEQDRQIYVHKYWDYDLSRILWATPYIFPLSNHVQYSYFFETPIFHTLLSCLCMWIICIHRKCQHKMSRCVLSFFHCISIIWQIIYLSILTWAPPFDPTDNF